MLYVCVIVYSVYSRRCLILGTCDAFALFRKRHSIVQYTRRHDTTRYILHHYSALLLSICYERVFGPDEPTSKICIKLKNALLPVAAAPDFISFCSFPCSCSTVFYVFFSLLHSSLETAKGFFVVHRRIVQYLLESLSLQRYAERSWTRMYVVTYDILYFQMQVLVLSLSLSLYLFSFVSSFEIVNRPSLRWQMTIA